MVLLFLYPHVLSNYLNEKTYELFVFTVSVCLLISALITGGDLNYRGQKIIGLAIINDIYKSDNPFNPLLIHLLEGKNGLQPLLPQERYFLSLLIKGNTRDVIKLCNLS